MSCDNEFIKVPEIKRPRDLDERFNWDLSRKPEKPPKKEVANKKLYELNRKLCGKYHRSRTNLNKWE